MQDHRSVKAALDVILARPHQVDRTTLFHGFCDLSNLDDPIGERVPTAPETATTQECVDLDLLRLEAEYLGSYKLVNTLKLASGPHFGAVLMNFKDAVQRLHGRVRQVGKSKLRFESLGGTRHRRCCIAPALCWKTLLLSKLAILFQDFGRRSLLSVRRVPAHLQCIATSNACPRVGCDHGNTV